MKNQNNMKLLNIQSYSGRNIYSHKPVVKLTVDIGSYGNGPTLDIPGFNEKIVRFFPGFSGHQCGIGIEGGFLQRLREGTYLGHVIEHLAIEIQIMNGHDVSYGKTRMISEPSVYYIVFEVKDEKCGVESGKAAFRIAGSIAAGVEFEPDEILAPLKDVFIEETPGPGMSAILAEAAKRGIPVMKHGDNGILQLGYGKYARCVSGTLTDGSSCVSVDTASNKQLTKRLLQDHGIPVPAGETAYSVLGAIDAANWIGYPVVIKPCDANQGKGVTMNIRSADDVPAAFEKASEYSRMVIVEKMVEGKDYRLLVAGGRLCAAAERTPPYVVGNGGSSLRQLIAAANEDPRRGEQHEKPLTKIKTDAVLMEVLGRSGRKLDYIPVPGETVYLRDNGNLSTGGTARDCTDEVHPSIAEAAVRSAEIIGLDIAGVDVTAADIASPLGPDGKNGSVIEVNAAPGIRMHLFPSSGQPRNIAADIMEMLFPPNGPVSIPIISITGTNGKTTTARLIKHTLSLMGMNVGMTSTSGIYIGEKLVLKGDNAGPASARVVLSDKTVDAAVLETARGGIIRKGLGYDLADIGIITNISNDHIGIDGINSVEELAFAKSLVTEAVKPGGYAVLNADDPMTPYIMGRTSANIFLFSRHSDNTLLAGHVRKGGKAVFMRNSKVYYHNGMRNIPLIDVSDIPLTFMCAAGFNAENSMTAAAALLALDTPVAFVKKGLRTFLPDIGSNPGRMNVFDLGGFKVMLDYGHNPAGISAVIDAVRSMAHRRCTGIIGMPGDRMDECISEVGRLCGQFFSKIYIKEDIDLRGRNPGETPELLYKSVLSAHIAPMDVVMISSETEALKKAIEEAMSGDFIVMFYEELEPALELLYGAVPSECQRQRPGQIQGHGEPDSAADGEADEQRPEAI